MGEPQYLKFPILPLAQSVFGLASPTTDTATKKTSLKTLQDAIREHKMAPLYAHLAHPQTGKLAITLQHLEADEQYQCSFYCRCAWRQDR